MSPSASPIFELRSRQARLLRHIACMLRRLDTTGDLSVPKTTGIIRQGSLCGAIHQMISQLIPYQAVAYRPAARRYGRLRPYYGQHGSYAPEQTFNDAGQKSSCGKSPRDQSTTSSRSPEAGLKLEYFTEVEKFKNSPLWPVWSEIPNPQPNPQNAMSCTTSACFGSPRGLCKLL